MYAVDTNRQPHIDWSRLLYETTSIENEVDVWSHVGKQLYREFPRFNKGVTLEIQTLEICVEVHSLLVLAVPVRPPVPGGPQEPWGPSGIVREKTPDLGALGDLWGREAKGPEPPGPWDPSGTLRGPEWPFGGTPGAPGVFRGALRGPHRPFGGPSRGPGTPGPGPGLGPGPKGAGPPGP